MLSVFKTNFKTNFKIGLFPFLVCIVLLAMDISHARERVLFKGIVNSYKLNIREKPSQAANVVIVVEKGDEINVLEKKGGIGSWLTVEFQGKNGYIRNRPKYIILKQVKEDFKKKVLQEKNATRGKIVSEEKKVAAFSRKEMEFIEGLNSIDYALNQARVKSDLLSTETMELAANIKKIRESRKILTSHMEDRKVYAGQRLNALYRMRMIGRMDMAGLPSSVFDFFLKQNSMKLVIQSDMEVLEAQAKDLKELQSLEKELNQQVAAKIELETELKLQIRIKEKETLKKETILQEIRRKRRLSQATLESLKKSALDLDKKLSLLGKEILEPIDESSFALQKGRLSIPVKGRIESKFGTAGNKAHKSFTFKGGIDIKVERGEPVRSVFQGEVIFAQWLKGYGNLIIVNHGDHYYTLYAHVEEIFKKKGETVDTGEVIATAGDTGSIKGVCLYFEVRHHGKPVNPMKWLKKGA